MDLPQELLAQTLLKAYIFFHGKERLGMIFKIIAILLTANVLVAASPPSPPPPSPPPPSPPFEPGLEFGAYAITNTPPASPTPATFISLIGATAYQDAIANSAWGPQNPINTNAFWNSDTGRPWSECEHYTPQWWGVDLGGEIFVDVVRLQNRNDCCENRLQNINIYMSDSAPDVNGNINVANMDLVAQDVDVQSNVMEEVAINSAGRYIYLYQTVSGVGLTICKIYVFASSPPASPPPPPLLPPPPSASPSPPPPSSSPSKLLPRFRSTTKSGQSFRTIASNATAPMPRIKNRSFG